MDNNDRFQEMIRLGDEYAPKIENSLQGVATTTLYLQKLVFQLTMICKEQEEKIKQLEEHVNIDNYIR